jgi:hypothetical protein
MPQILAHLKGRRRGIVTVLVAMALIGLVGVAAIAVDGGLLQDNRRRVQAATDAAALAAAQQLFAEFRTIILNNYTIADPGSKAAPAAYASAATNGYTNDGVQSSVTVNIPPKSGPFTGKIGYAEVLITYYQPRYFSSIWGNSTIPVTARAVAQGSWMGSNDGIIVLDPTAKDAFNDTGGGVITVTGGANVIVDSNNPASAANSNGGGQPTASNFLVTGGANGTFYGNLQTGVPPTPDPYRDIPAPTKPPAGTMTKKNIPGGGTQYNLTPGSYSNLPNFTNGDQVTLQQASAGNGGIYWIQGGFTSNGANITMDPTTSGGLMFVNDPTNSSNSQGFSIAGSANGVVNLSPPTSGPYAGFMFWQDRTATQTLNLQGNGNFTILGTFYAANAQMAVAGGSSATIGSQYVSRTVTFSGSGNTTIAYTDKGTARMRIIRLVE